MSSAQIAQIAQIGTYTARIILRRTGTAVDSVQLLFEGVAADSLVHYWTEGNFGCDCNRGTEFRRALYPNPPADDPHWNRHPNRCSGASVRYVVPYLVMADGEKILIDEGRP